MQIQGRQVDVRGLADGFDEPVEIPHARELAEFAEAVVLRDEARTTRARTALLPGLGEPGVVDAAAVIAAFHGFVRIADAIGIPYRTAARGADAPEIRERAGVNSFPRVMDDAKAGTA